MLCLNKNNKQEKRKKKKKHFQKDIGTKKIESETTIQKQNKYVP